VRILEVTAPALVLGSTQSAATVRPGTEQAGVDVVRRRSGGGAVLVEADGVVWVDVVIGRTDPRWSDDVGTAFWWLGEVWATALASAGITSATVHRGGLQATRWSSLICFAGLGPGEVTLGAGGPKIVGMAQRRTRDAALFQCAVPRTWSPAAIVALRTNAYSASRLPTSPRRRAMVPE